VITQTVAAIAGHLSIPLPYPAVGKVVHVVPGDVLPWRPRPMEVCGVAAPVLCRWPD
jgi:hypothetical protein